MTSRILTFEGVDNFRDFGDYATAAGKRISSGRLYRSAHHAQASDADLQALAELNIAVIVDLRRSNERLRGPSRRAAGFSGRVIENDIGDHRDDPWRSFLTSSDLSVESFRGFMLDYYRVAPFEARHVDLYSRYFQALGEAEGAVLIHCAAGKDRTGLLAALTHHLLGVHADDMIEDYLLTNAGLNIERRMSVVADYMAREVGRTLAPEAVRTAMSVDAEYLQNAFAAIEDQNGGVDAYLRDVLGVDDPLRGRIEARLLG